MKKIILAAALAFGTLLAVSRPASAAENWQGTQMASTNYQGVAYAQPSNVATTHLESWQVPKSGYGGYMPSTGKVVVNLAQRGGTCNIRYTETKEKFYKYRTSAGCDEVQHVVGSLLPGEQYQFEVSQESWDNWSTTAVAKAI